MNRSPVFPPLQVEDAADVALVGLLCEAADAPPGAQESFIAAVMRDIQTVAPPLASAVGSDGVAWYNAPIDDALLLGQQVADGEANHQEVQVWDSMCAQRPMLGGICDELPLSQQVESQVLQAWCNAIEQQLQDGLPAVARKAMPAIPVWALSAVALLLTALFTGVSVVRDHHILSTIALAAINVVVLMVIALMAMSGVRRLVHDGQRDHLYQRLQSRVSLPAAAAVIIVMIVIPLVAWATVG